jgi:hypothetical protein
MSSLEIVLTVMVVILFLGFGVIAGWLFKEHSDKSIPVGIRFVHPELFDENGNLIPDQVISLRVDPMFYEEIAELEGYGDFDEDDES